MNLRYTLNVVALAFILHTFNACATPLPLINTINTRTLVAPSADSGVNLRTSGEINAPRSLDLSPMNLSIRSDRHSDSELELPDAFSISPSPPPDPFQFSETSPSGIQLERDLRHQANDHISTLRGYWSQIDACTTSTLTVIHNIINLLKPYPEHLAPVINSAPVKKAIGDAPRISEGSRSPSPRPSGSSSLPSTSAKRKYPEEMVTAAKELIKVIDPHAARSHPMLTKAQVDAEMKKHQEQLAENERKRIEAAKNAQNAMGEILVSSGEIVRHETNQFLVAGDHRYTDGGPTSYRETTVLGLIAFANRVLAAETTSDPVKEIATSCITNVQVIDDRIMGRGHTTGGR